MLDARQLLTAIAWTGAGDGTTWHLAANWSPAQIPTSADAVTISNFASSTINLTQAENVLSLTDDATLQFSSGALNFNSGDLTLVGGATVNLGSADGASAGTMTFLGADRASGAVIGGTGTLLFGPNGSNAVVNQLTRGAGNTNVASTQVRIGANVATRGGSGTFRNTFGPTSGIPESFLFQGPVSSDAAGTLNVSSTSTFSGALNVSVGAVAISGGFNLTTLNVSGGNFTVSGIAFSQSNLGAITHTGGSIVIGSGATLTGNLALSTSTGEITLTGGTLSAGTYTATGSGVLTAKSGTLGNYVLASTLDLTPSSVTLSVAGTLTLSNANVLLGSADGTTSSGLTFVGADLASGAMIGGTGEVIFGGSASNALVNQTTRGNLNTNVASTQLTIGQNVSVHGTAGNIRNVFGATNGIPESVLIAGSLTADNAGGTITQNIVTSVSSTGSINVTGGTFTFDGSFANGGTVNLAAGQLVFSTTFTQANLGTFNRTGGNVNIPNGGILVGNLLLSNSTGPFTLSGGTLQSGTYSGSGTGILNVTGGKLDTYTLASDLDLSANSVTVTIAGDLTLANNSTLTLGNPSGTTADTLSFSSTDLVNGATLGGTGTVMLGGSTSNIITNALLRGSTNTNVASSQLTIGSGIIVRGSSGNFRANNSPQNGIPQTLRVNASIDAETSSGSISTSLPTTIGSQGVVDVTAGTFTFSSTFSNQGAIDLSAGSLVLDGAFAQSDLGTFNRSGGTVTIGSSGVLSGNLALTAATGSFVLSGGTLQNGTFTATGGAAILVDSSATLDGYVLANDLDLSPVSGATVTVKNGLTLSNNSTLTLGNPAGTTYAFLRFSGTDLASGMTLGGVGTISFGGSTSNTLYNVLLRGTFNTNVASTQLTIGAGISLHGTAGAIRNNNSPQNGISQSLLLQGPLSAETNGGEITLGIVTSVASTGSINVVGGTVTFSSSFVSSGALNVSAGLLDLDGPFTQAGLGNFTRNGGSVILDSSGQLSGNLALTASTGSWTLQGGTLQSGTYTSAGGAALAVNNGTLDDYTIGSDLDLTTTSGISLTVRDGLTLANNSTIRVGNSAGTTYGLITFSGTDVTGGQVISGAGTILLGASSNNTIANGMLRGSFNTNVADTQLTIGPGISVRGLNGTIRNNNSPQNGFPQSLLVQGSIMAEQAPGVISVTLPTTVTGTVAATGGTFSFSSSFASTGQTTLSGGAIDVSGTTTQTGLGTLVRTGGNVIVTNGGLITGNLTVSDATGPVLLQGGTLRGGTYSATGSSSLQVSNGTLDNYALATGLDMTTTAGQSLNVSNGLTFANNVIVALGSSNGNTYATLTFLGQDLAGGLTVGGTGTFVLGGSGNNSLTNQLTRGSLNSDPVATRLTFGPGITIRGAAGFIRNSFSAQNGIPESVDIQGALIAQVPTATINLSTQTQVTGTAAATGGTLAFSGGLTNLSGSTLTGGTFTVIDGGRLQVSNIAIGTLAATVTLGAGSSFSNYSNQTSAFSQSLLIAPAGSLFLSEGQDLALPALTNQGLLSIGPDTVLTVTGAFSNASTGTLSVPINGAGVADYGTISAGTAQLGGTLAAPLGNGFDPIAGTQVTILTAGAIAGTFANYTPDMSSGGNTLPVQYAGTAVILSGETLVAPSTPVMSAASDTGSSSADAYTSNTSPIFIGTAPAGSVVTIFSDGTVVGTGTATTGGAYSIQVSPLLDGVHAITAGVGPGGAIVSAALSATIDTVAPTAVPPGNLSAVATSSSGAAVTFSVSATDALDSNPTAVASSPSGSTFSVGSTPVTVTATDRAGNSSTANFFVTVTAPPTIGGLDTSFGNGTGQVSVTVLLAQLHALDSLSLGDGRVLIAGYDPNTNTLLTLRLNADGSLDSTYGTNGSIRVQIPTGVLGRRVQFDSAPGGSNQIFLTGQNAAGQPVIVRVSQDGIVDAGFGTGGVLTITALAAGDQVDSFITVAKSFVAGGARTVGGARSAVIFGVNADGSLNVKFGTKGFYLRPGGPLDTVSYVTLDAKKAIYFTGTTSVALGDGTTNTAPFAGKLSAAGKPDKAFGVKALTTPGYAVSAGQKVAIQADGKVLVSASIATNSTTALAGQFGSATFRLTTKGLADTTFDVDGYLLVSTPVATLPSGLHIASMSLWTSTISTAAAGSGSSLADMLTGAIASIVQTPGNRIRAIAATVDSDNSTILTQSQIVADAVDLVAGALTLVAKKPVKGGSKLSASVKVSNSGTLPSAKTVPVQLYLSSDPALDSGDTALPVINAALSLKAATSKTIKLAFATPATPGTYYLIAVVDSGPGAVADLMAGNNQAAGAPTFVVAGATAKADLISWLPPETVSLFGKRPITLF